MKKKRIIKIAIIIAVVVFATVGLISHDVDIMTGRTCWSVTLGITLRGWAKESPLSKMLTPEEIKAATPQWESVIVNTPIGMIIGMHAHPSYHGAIAQINMWEWIWRKEAIEGKLPDDITEALKRKTARDVLALWQAGDGDWFAGRYLRCLQDMVWNGKGDEVARLEALLELEIVQIATNGNEVTTLFLYPNGRPMRYVRNDVDAQYKTVFFWEPNGVLSEIVAFENGERSGSWRDSELFDNPLTEEAVRIGMELAKSRK